jgi:hypothetical protein
MRKTPRDLLLARHSGSTPQLDELRRTALADSLPIPAGQLLHAIFFPQRRLWIGLAAVWIVIFAVNFSQRSPTRSNPAATLCFAKWSANQAQLHALLTEIRALL